MRKTLFGSRLISRRQVFSHALTPPEMPQVRLPDIKAEQFRPDCIIIDVAAASVDGLQVARNLRQNPNFRDVVLVALVGEHARVDGAELKAAGFNDYFVQPFDTNLLVERIRSLVSLRKE